MNATETSGQTRSNRWSFLGKVPPCSRVVVSWAAAGGIVAGGLLVGFAALGSPEMAQGLLPLTPVLFVVGALGGLLHGSILAYVGRPTGVRGTAAVVAIGAGILVAIPTLVVAWVASAWISLTSAVLTMQAWRTVVVTATGWVVGLAVCFWAAVEGWSAFRTAFSRWPESRPGALLLAGAAVIFAALFIHYHPEIWWTDYRVTGIGALILALVATVWIALPIIVVLLHYLHRRFASVWDSPTTTKNVVQPDP